MIRKVCICGAGTMGTGIAQVTALSGFKTLLFDLDNKILERSKITIEENINSLLFKGKISQEDADISLKNIEFKNDIKYVIGDLIIEAVIEDLQVKIDLFKLLSVSNKEHTILATNTSSFSISALQKNIDHPERIIGLHFFNPAPQMKLVEVVEGKQSSSKVVKNMLQFCKSINKTPVVCKDSPGFIVNRVARHFYLEAMKLEENNIATLQDIDVIMESTGFKLGPFRLMDLIGLDINLAVSKQLYGESKNACRFKPVQRQVDLVEKGKLGRKTGEGFYKYPKQK